MKALVLLLLFLVVAVTLVHSESTDATDEDCEEESIEGLSGFYFLGNYKWYKVNIDETKNQQLGSLICKEQLWNIMMPKVYKT